MKKLNLKQLPLLIPAIIYATFYLMWFAYVERTVTSNFTLIHMKWDNYIPFLEAFVIPYFLWFPYIALTVVFFCLTDKKDYIRTCFFLFSGMTIFLIVSTLFPNGHNLRPTTFPRDNIFTNMVASLYATDTSTNIVPSIHVYNSIVIHIAFLKSNTFKNKKWVCAISAILCISIILSTVFIKQHSLFDVVTAFILAGVIYPFVYILDYHALRTISRQRREKKEERVS